MIDDDNQEPFLCLSFLDETQCHICTGRVTVWETEAKQLLSAKVLLHLFPQPQKSKQSKTKRGLTHLSLSRKIHKGCWYIFMLITSVYKSKEAETDVWKYRSQDWERCREAMLLLSSVYGFKYLKLRPDTTFVRIDEFHYENIIN